MQHCQRRWHLHAAVEHQFTSRHCAGKRQDGDLALAHDAQFAQVLCGCTGQRGGIGKGPQEARKRGLQRTAKSIYQPLTQGTRGLYGNLLSQHGTYRQLKAIPGAGHAHAQSCGKVRSKAGVDGHGVGVKVEQRAQSRHNDIQCTRKRF